MKHYRVEIMPTARAGLLEIGEYIALDNPTRALPHGNYNSYYRVIEEKQLVEVLYVFNGSRDIQALMAEL